MTNLPIPAVPDLARVNGETRNEVIDCLRHYYETSGPFNYLSAIRSVKSSYKGFHDLPQLIAGCAQEKTKQGRQSNEEVVRLAAPSSFDRKT
jgi:hypothetical protein